MPYRESPRPIVVALECTRSVRRRSSPTSPLLSRGMPTLTLPDGRRCDLEVQRDPDAGPQVRISIDGEPSALLPLTANWEQTADLPPAVVEAIIRHVLLE